MKETVEEEEMEEKTKKQSIYVCLSKQSLVISFNNRLTDIWRNVRCAYLLFSISLSLYMTESEFI